MIVGRPATRRLFVRGLVLRCNIGVHVHEKDRRQRVRIGIDLDIAEHRTPLDDDIANVVSYDDMVAAVRRVAEAGHINLVETLAERIAEACLGDPRVAAARVLVEKLDVLGENAVVGVEVEHRR